MSAGGIRKHDITKQIDTNNGDITGHGVLAHRSRCTRYGKCILNVRKFEQNFWVYIQTFMSIHTQSFTKKDISVALCKNDNSECSKIN